MDKERFRKLNEEIKAIGMSNFGNFEEIEGQSMAVFERYGTTQAEFDRQLAENLRELRRWRDSGFKDDAVPSSRPRRNGIMVAIVGVTVLIIALVAWLATR